MRRPSNRRIGASGDRAVEGAPVWALRSGMLDSPPGFEAGCGHPVATGVSQNGCKPSATSVTNGIEAARAGASAQGRLGREQDRMPPRRGAAGSRAVLEAGDSA